MPGFLIKRLLQSALILGLMSGLVFLALYAVGDPVTIFASPQADPQEIARTTRALGLDQPLLVQYGRFLRAAVEGDLGRSFVHGTSAVRLILGRLPATLELAFAAMLIAVVFGIPLGLWAGLRPRSIPARILQTFALLGFSLPTFWVGLLLILLFSIHLAWLPASGRGPTEAIAGIDLSITSLEGWRHILLPALNLSVFKLALLIRLTSSATQDALRQDFVLLARAKGLTPSRIVGVHVLKIILIPLITVIGLELGSLIAFAVVTETIFAWPGIGKLLIDSILQLDRPVVVAYLLITVSLFVLINLIVDLLYAALDPRVRLTRGGT